MKTKPLALAVLLLATAILISGCGNKPAVQSGAQNNAVTNQSQNQNQGGNQAAEQINPSGSYSINELFTMNKPMKCTWKESLNQGAEVTNILYLKGKKFYQDVTMGDLGHAYTLSDGEYFYMWNDFNTVATKFKNTEIKATTEAGAEKTNDSAGLEQKRDFLCENWSADDSLFIPPQDKNFKDMTEEMTQATQQMKETGVENAKKQMCDLCQKAPDQKTKDDCLKNAGCSQ